MPVKLEQISRNRAAAGSREEARGRKRKRRVLDKTAKWLATLGGFAIIASIIAIVLFIFVEVLPLFRSAKVTPLHAFQVQKLLPPDAEHAEVVAVGLEENQEVGYVLTRGGVLQFFDVIDRRPRELFRLVRLQGAEISAIWQSLDGRRLLLGTTRGTAFLVDVAFHSKFFEGQRTYNPTIAEGSLFTIDPEGQALRQVAFAGEPEESMAVAALTAAGKVRVFFRKQEESLFGDAEVDSANYALPRNWADNVVSLALDGGMKNLYLGSDDGKIYYWTVSFDDGPEFVSTVQAGARQVQISTLKFLIGDRTLMVGDTKGDVSAWFLVRDASSPNGWRLRRIHEMAHHDGPVTFIAASARGKGFISGGSRGILRLQYTTSERLLATFHADSSAAVRFINFTPKANGALTLDANGTLAHWKIVNPHPEASFKAFFGKIWYEGYPEPEYVWQSTGGSDDFEPKLSLVPLIFGSLKGTLYALIIALPLAILGALYTSQFMHPALRSKIKPAVEVMAALPSVVLGFLAGLWLAPRMENVIPGIVSLAVVLPVILILSAWLWRHIPRSFRGRFRPGVESLLGIPVVLLGIWVAFQLNGYIEHHVFSGDFKNWLYQTLNLAYDQRNALVVGIAMGFAVIPIIYTISEDALSNVPRNLVSGSLALGATRWQTAVKVVLPAAIAGIFSAIMIGFGRAVGETMIVLMATGNTPIMDWNIFNGFRTLSANIAVEIPEAPVGGTLYRVLFLSAILLFVLTFFVNTLAEVVRQKLRQKYQKL